MGHAVAPSRTSVRMTGLSDALPLDERTRRSSASGASALTSRRALRWSG